MEEEMKRFSIILLVLSVSVLPLGAFAMSHEKHEQGGMKMDHVEHCAMMMEVGMIML